MRYEDTNEQYSKVVRGWNARYDLNEFIAQHGLQPLAARELFAKFDRTKWIWIAKSQSYGRNGTRIADPAAEHSCRDNGQTTLRELIGR